LNKKIDRSALLWLTAALIGYCLLPWYILEDGLFSFEWLDGYPFDSDYAPALFLVAQGEKLWLAPIGLAILAAVPAVFSRKSGGFFSNCLIIAGCLGLLFLCAQGLSIGIRGWNAEWLSALFGELSDRQFGMGYGALFVSLGFLFFLTTGLAAKGAINGDAFVVGAVGFIVAIVSVFIFFPILEMLSSAIKDYFL